MLVAAFQNHGFSIISPVNVGSQQTSVSKLQAFDMRQKVNTRGLRCSVRPDLSGVGQKINT